MKKNIIIIGTLHAGFTPTSELKEILKKYNPNQILIEIDQADINSLKINSFPPEMIFAYKWAINNNVEVAGFDSKINVFKSNFSPIDNQNLINEQKKIINKFNWKEFNQPQKNKLLKTPTYHKLIDPKKSKERREKMISNINKSIIKKGTIIILTGTDNLNFFKKNITDAHFPFCY